MSSLRRPVGPHPPATYWRRRAVVLVAVLALVYLPVRACGDSSPETTRKAQARPGPSLPASTPAPSGSPGADHIQDPEADASGGPATGGQVSGGPATSGQVPGGSAAGGQPAGPALGPIGVGSGRGLAPDLPQSPVGSGQGGTAGSCPHGDFLVITRADQRVYGAGAVPRLTLTVKNVGSRSCRLEVGQSLAALRVTSGADRVWSSADCARRQGTNVQLLGPGTTVLLRQVDWARTRSREGCPGGLPTAKAGTYMVTGEVRGLSSTRDVFDLR